MSIVFALAACIVAMVAAVRSTWSPCGLSMLSTITPLAESGRGHRYTSTTRWFVGGSVVGGATLGVVMALLALGVQALSASTMGLAVVAACACALTAAADARIAGFRLPVHHRQVNERWLDQFRPWVYGAGFGWQIGAGVVTYIKTGAVYLMIVLAVLTGDPGLAFAVGMLFGLVRGLAVLLSRRVTSPAALAQFHRRFMAASPISLAAAVVCEAAGGVLFSALASPWLGAVFASLLVATVLSRSVRRRPHQATATS